MGTAGNVFIDCGYLYNMLQQLENGFSPKLADSEYLLLIDCRTRKEYNESHIISAKLAKKDDEDKLIIPSDWHVEFKEHTVVYDGNTSVYAESSHAIRCARQLWRAGARNPIMVVRGGYELFSRHYPFLRTQKILWTPMEFEALSTYPFEIIAASVYQGSRSQAERPEVLKDVKIGAVINCTNVRHDRFDEKTQLQLNSLKDDLDDDFLSVLKLATDFILANTSHGRRVLIYSESGVNRSVVIAIAYLMTQNNYPLEKAYEIVRRSNFSARPTRPAIEQLSAWEEQLLSTRTTDVTDTNPIY